MQKSEQINELATALSKAQGEIKGALKDSSNPFFKSKYADLASVWDAFREPFKANGLSLIQLPSMKETQVCVESILLHASGQFISEVLCASPKDASPQAVGSTITYLRRYGAQSIAGVCPEDDDGNAGSQIMPAAKTKITVAQKNQVHEDTLKYLEQGDEHGLRETWHGWGADEKSVLWGMFNSEQRTAIKKLMG
jgi:hypothetical protein